MKSFKTYLNEAKSYEEIKKIVDDLHNKYGGDGHHRVVAESLRRKKYIPAEVINLDT